MTNRRKIGVILFVVSLILLTNKYFHLSEDFDDLHMYTKTLLSSRYRSPYPVISISMFDEYAAYKEGCLLRHLFADKDLRKRFTVNSNGSDVIVLLRIQKTGSTTMDNHLVRDLDARPWCQYKGQPSRNRSCFKEWQNNVLFKRSTGEWPCGVHSDWTYTQECAQKAINRRQGRAIKQRHLYVTVIRDPVQRYISEWLHVKRRATWKGAPYICDGRSATKQEIPPCYTTPNWTGVTLQEFMDCPSNLALNRQTRMLANLSLVNCYNTSGMSHDGRHVIMLKSAKENLKNMSFFGLTSYQQLSQILFENTFNLKFTSRFADAAHKNSYSGRTSLNKDIRDKIIYLNRYDVMLYQYAKDLFIQRLLKLARTAENGLLRGLILTKTGDLVNQYGNTSVKDDLIYH